jgi:regulatory protein
VRRPRSRARPSSREKAPLDAKAARAAALDLLAKKAWTSRELSRRLARRGAPTEVARDVIADLEARGYLNDLEFARRWAETRARARNIGPLRLSRELSAKGIPRDIAQSAIEAAFEGGSQEERAIAAGQRRLAALLRATPDRVAPRLASHLLRRGYPPAVVRRVVRRLTGTDPGEADGV